jgi:hypothetical protein
MLVYWFILIDANMLVSGLSEIVVPKEAKRPPTTVVNGNGDEVSILNLPGGTGAYAWIYNYFIPIGPNEDGIE